MNKNDIYEGEIVAMSSEGLGITKNCGMAVFIKNTAIGDFVRYKIIKVLKNYAVARLEEIIKSSPDRIENDCPYFNRCGGCTYRHISYNAEEKIKYGKVKETMHRIGKVQIDPMPIITNKQISRYRNKAQYPVSENLNIGFFAPRTHTVTEISDCLLQPKEFTLGAEIFTEWAKKNKLSAYNEITGRGKLRHFYMRKAFFTGELSVCAVIKGELPENTDKLVNSLKSALGQNLKTVVFNVNNKNTNVILGDKNILLYGDGYITDVICGIKVKLSALSFYQVNREMAQLLYNKAKEYANPKDKNLLDLYCGTGTIGLTMAKAAKSVIGVEIVPDAVKDALENAKLNGITNARFICSDATSAAQKLKAEGMHPDVVLLDPPRKGCDSELLNVVAKYFSPERIVYISCDVSTLARDTAILETLGYTLKEYTPVDLFPRTPHVETVALLVRTDSLI